MRDPLTAPVRVAFAGDWHMNTAWARRAIAYAAEHDADVILHLGDFGYTFDADFMTGVEEALADADLPLLFVDGNHEDFDHLYAWPVAENGLRRLTDHVWHLPRGLRWTWAGIRFLALGGATSVDRRHRVPGSSWWPQEAITTADAARAIAGGPADVLLTHDCPAGTGIGPDPGTTSRWIPEDAMAAAEAHRALLRGVVDAVQPRRIWHGHFHRCYWTRTDLGYGPVTVHGLDCDGTRLHLNVSIGPLTELQPAFVPSLEDGGRDA